MAAVAFYISGHGFGHASRQIEIAKAFARRRPDVGILLRTTAARWLFDRTMTAPFILDDRPCDTGAVQKIPSSDSVVFLHVVCSAPSSTRERAPRPLGSVARPRLLDP